LVARADVVKMNEEEADLLIGGSSRPLRDQITESSVQNTITAPFA
jgi:fructokinase